MTLTKRSKVKCRKLEYVKRVGFPVLLLFVSMWSDTHPAVLRAVEGKEELGMSLLLFFFSSLDSFACLTHLATAISFLLPSLYPLPLPLLYGYLHLSHFSFPRVSDYQSLSLVFIFLCMSPSHAPFPTCARV